MQCANAVCITATQLPVVRASNSQVKLSVSRTRETLGPRNCSSNLDYGEGKDHNLPVNVKSIVSTSNPFIKHCVKLRLSSSYRHSHGCALVVGMTPVREIFNFYKMKAEPPVTDSCVLLLDKAEIPHGLDDIPVSIVRISSTVMKKLSGLQSPDSLEVVAMMKIPSTFNNLDDSRQEKDYGKWFPSTYRILVLDGIQDPGNLGTLIRSALAFRWDGVFLLPGCCDPFNEKALRASRGASFQIPIVSGSWTHLQALRDEFHLKIIAGHAGSDAQSKQISRLSKGLANSLAETQLCVVLGSEGSGLSEKTRQVCELVSIPMAGDFESLNVSVAGGIFLYMLQPESNQLS